MTMNFSCSVCNNEYPIDTRNFRCTCGGPFKLHWEPKPFSTSALKERERSIWRYRESIPVIEDRNIVSLGEGLTPLLPFSYRDFEKVLLKLDYLCPTGSFKDRGSSVMISKAKELSIRKVVADSSGNAGSSIAGYAAKAGIGCMIYCPAHASEGKLVQIRAYGAQLVKVSGTRADTAAAAQEEAKRTYYASQNWNPFFLEGIKTLAFEICEQLDWKIPDAVICPTGYSGIYLGLYYGFKELRDQGIVKKVPRLIGVQAETIPPIYQAFSRGAKEVEAVPSAETLAEGINCIKPIRGKEILEVSRSTGGCFEIASEKEIVEGWKELAQRGIYVEPTSAVVVRAMDHLVLKGLLNRRDQIVLILTGIGLKATEKLAAFVEAS